MNTKEKKYFQKLGANIKQLREEKGMDQKSFAFDCGIGRTQLYMIENGKTNNELVSWTVQVDVLQIGKTDRNDQSKNCTVQTRCHRVGHRSE